MQKIVEYRGVEGLVYAKIIEDSLENLSFGEVKSLAGVAEISRSTESSNATHYYDNIPAVVIQSTGSDEVTINTSVIPMDVLAEITGQVYDADTGMFIEQERDPGYFAIGYQTKLTDGTKVLVWRLKGSFSLPDSDHKTEDDGTDANGQELTYTGISTTYKFTKTGKPAKAINVNTAINTAVTPETFFASVQTPDTVTGPTDIHVTGVGIAPASLALTVGDKADVIATVVPVNASDKSVSFTSSDDTVATVDETGKVEAVGAGTASISVTTTDGSFTDTCAVTVTSEE